MDFGSFLILTAFAIVLDGVGFSLRKNIFFLFSVLVESGTLASAIQDNAANGGQGFVVGQALSSGGTYVLRYQPLVPLVYIGVFATIMSVLFMASNWKRRKFL